MILIKSKLGQIQIKLGSKNKKDNMYINKNN